MDDTPAYAKDESRTGHCGRPVRCDPERLAEQILALCGDGTTLVVSGRGEFFALVGTLLKRGFDAHGFGFCEYSRDGAEPIDPARFQRGSILAMPYPGDAFQTVAGIACLEHIPEEAVPAVLGELYRVTQRHLFIQLNTGAKWDKHRPIVRRDRDWWEMRFYEAGFRRHPALQTSLPYESLERESGPFTLLFEKIPAVALAKYPLASLKSERDLHMDMLREPGRRSDAHCARYTLARQYLPSQGLVLDAACGLGYGSVILASGRPQVSVVGIDASAFAVGYARCNFPGWHSNVEFRQQDVCDLCDFADESVEVVVSFETIEHLTAPEIFLREARRVLKPGGVFIGSVPNLWLDEAGRDPNPWHCQVFDFAALAKLMQRFFFLRDVFRQNAGGGLKLPQSPRALQSVNLPVTTGQDSAEWWIVAAVREEAAPREIISGTPRSNLVLLTADVNHPLYSSWLPHWKLPWRVINPQDADLDALRNAALLVTHDTYVEPGRGLVCQAVAAGIPTLILADGILEYRNTWEHPQLEPGAMFQPVVGHKIACLGQSQGRYLESWGNAGKCEIVGSPRFDRYYGLKRRQRKMGTPFRVLVATALTPWFTEGQRHLVTRSLRDVKEFLGEQQLVGEFGIEVIWRLTQGLEKELGVPATTTDLTGRELAEVLQQVDAVITTPSTAILEAMLLGLPVAVLDYGNSPHYVQPAWRITARRHLPEVLLELMNPPEPKMLFQETVLHEALECFTPATPRLLQLMRAMIAAGRKANAGRQPLQFARQILRPGHAPQPRENRFGQPSLPPTKLLSIAARQLPGTPQDFRADSSSKPSIAPGAVSALATVTEASPQRGKVLFICHEASRTGAPILLLDLLRRMRAANEWELRILLRAGGPLESQFHELGETIVTNGAGPEAHWLEGVSLIYSNTCANGNFLRPLATGKVPVITHIHELPFTIESFGKENFEAVRNQTNHFIACSKSVADGLQQSYQVPAAMISVVHGGIGVQAVKDGAAARTAEEVRRWCGLPDDGLVVAACGFADWRKGPDLFLRLAESLRKWGGTCGEISFLWIGRLPEDSGGRFVLHDLRQLGLAGVVKFIGEVGNPHPFLNVCDVFCLCSREDPFPLAMLEAAALGKPVVCFEKAGGAGEFCAQGGGMAVPYLDLEAMARRLRQLLQDKTMRRQMGETAARLVREKFDLAVVGPQIMQLIQRFSRAPMPVPVTEPKVPGYRKQLHRISRSFAGMLRPNSK